MNETQKILTFHLPKKSSTRLNTTTGDECSIGILSPIGIRTDDIAEAKLKTDNADDDADDDESESVIAELST